MEPAMIEICEEAQVDKSDKLLEEVWGEEDDLL